MDTWITVSVVVLIYIIGFVAMRLWALDKYTAHDEKAAFLPIFWPVTSPWLVAMGLTNMLYLRLTKKKREFEQLQAEMARDADRMRTIGAPSNIGVVNSAKLGARKLGPF